MIRLKKFICATDFSLPARRAVAYARTLAGRFDAELVLINVVDTLPTAIPPVGGSPVATALNVTEYEDMMAENARKNLDELVAALDAPDLAVRVHVARGRPSAEIVHFAEEEQADLVIIATHGHNRFHRFVFGSVADRVVRSATCPVLTVPPGDED